MTYPEYDDDQQDEGQQQDDGRHVRMSRDQIKSLERDAKRARDADAELATTKRELALARSGLSTLTERQQKALLADIGEADLTPDALRQAATELGFIQPEKQESGSTETLAAEGRMADAAAATGGSHADEDAVSALHRADREGGRDAVLAELRKAGALAE